MNIDVIADGRLQFSDAAEHAPANALVGDLGKPALHQVEPGPVGGREVHMKAWSFGKPFPNDVGLVGSVIVQHDMDIEIRGNVGLDGVQKPAELLRTVTAMQLPDDTAGLQLQCVCPRGVVSSV